MPKYKTKILYYNNGKVISQSVLGKDLTPETVTQEQVNIAFPLILGIYQQEANNARAVIVQGRKELREFSYT